MEFCLLENDHPISDVIRFLDPVQVYVSAFNVYAAVKKWSDWMIERERIWVFNGNSGELFQGGTTIGSLDDARDQYKTLIADRFINQPPDA